MLTWITENIATIIVTLILILVVIAIIKSMIKHKKAGKSPCGGNCSHCAMGGTCHKHWLKQEGAPKCVFLFFLPLVSFC